jgi:hypothetical protein
LKAVPEETKIPNQQFTMVRVTILSLSPRGEKVAHKKTFHPLCLWKKNKI